MSLSVLTTIDRHDVNGVCVCVCAGPLCLGFASLIYYDRQQRKVKEIERRE